MSFGSPASTAVAAFVAQLVEQNQKNYAALHALIVNMSVVDFTSFCQQQEQIAATAAPKKKTASRMITDLTAPGEVVPGMGGLTVTAPKPRAKRGAAAANAMSFEWDRPANTATVNNAFAQPGAFAAPATQPNAFAAPAQPAAPAMQTNAFVAPVQSNAFAAPAQPAQPAMQTNAFVAPAQTANPFGGPTESAAVVW